MKKVLIVGLVAMIAAFGLAAELKTITIAAGAASGSWTNDDGLPKVAEIKAVYGTLGAVAADADTVTVAVNDNSVAYVVDSATITSNTTPLKVDMDTTAVVDWGESVTITREATTTTNTSLTVVLVIE